MSFILKKIILVTIMVWQKIFSAQTGFFSFLYSTPILNIGGGRRLGCRYWPNCSEYTKQAIKTYPLGRALKVSIKRISRCRGNYKGGYDPLFKKV